MNEKYSCKFPVSKTTVIEICLSRISILILKNVYLSLSTSPVTVALETMVVGSTQVLLLLLRAIPMESGDKQSFKQQRIWVGLLKHDGP